MDVLERILSDAMRSPTAGNTRGTAWVVLESPEQTAVYFGATTDEESGKVMRLTPDGVTKTVAGGGSFGSGDPDGVQATSADLRLGNETIEVAPDGTIYFTETGNGKASIRRVTPDHILSSIAGNNVPGFSGDGVRSLLSAPAGLHVVRRSR